MTSPRARARRAPWLLVLACSLGAAQEAGPAPPSPAPPAPAAPGEGGREASWKRPAARDAGPAQDTVPDFELPLAADPARTLRRSSFAAGQPLALVFADPAGDTLRSSAGRLRELAALYGGELRFLLVCPARPGDGATLEQRGAACSAALQALELSFPAVLDRPEDSVGQAHAARSERLVLIAADGRLAFVGAPGPAGFDPDALELAILRRLLAGADGPSALGAPPAPRQAPHGLLEALDTDGDGVLSPPEIEGSPAVLRGFDLDGDGTLTPEEVLRALRPERGPAGAPGAARREPVPPSAPAQGGEARSPGEPRSLESFDSDGDGRLSRIEVPRGLLERWELYDTDGDGYLSAAEQAPLRERWNER